jgi:predicted methyltransferase
MNRASTRVRLSLIGLALFSLFSFALPAADVATENAIAASIASPNRPQDDIVQDSWRKPQVVLNFLKVRPGMQALDYLAGSGYYSELISRIVGPTGHVIVYNNPRYASSKSIVDKLPQRFANNRLTNAQVVIVPTRELTLAANSLDVVLLVQSYHDLYWQPKEDSEPFGDPKQTTTDLFRALKSGGLVVVVDHSAKSWLKPKFTAGLFHRIDPQVVKDDFLHAGFIFDGEDTALRNPDDNLIQSVFDDNIRHKTDQFIYRFRKP